MWLSVFVCTLSAPSRGVQASSRDGSDTRDLVRNPNRTSLIHHILFLFVFFFFSLGKVETRGKETERDHYG